ncbi:MAG TPA: hyalin, partial [Thermoanaerobaculia bacterium]
MVLLTGWISGEAQAQPAYLVKDINTNQPTSFWNYDFKHETEGAGGVFYFAFDDGIHGSEIWRSDGTLGGTHLLEDICPGACSSEPRALTASGDLLFFTADDQINGRRLWRSDGTPQGTYIVANVLPGVTSTRDSLLDGEDGTLYFSAYNPTDGAEIWATEGTVEGTHRLADIPLEGGQGPRLLAAGDGLVLFAAAGESGWETWITDGTETGTRMLADISPGFDGPFLYSNFASGREAIAAPWGGFIFAGVDAEGPEVWITDGTPEGTSLLKNIVVGGGSFPYGFTVLNGVVIFVAIDSVHGTQPWRTDGTPAGTFFLKTGSSSGASNLTAVGNQAFFQASTPESGMELWATDGTPAGTRLVRD